MPALDLCTKARNGYAMNTNKVLFICTGNFYRSRFAEAIFNYHQPEGWRAFSRGLAIHLAEGDLSPFTKEGLTERNIPFEMTGPTRVTLTEADLHAADLRIALDKEEHLEMIREQFPAWESKIEFWDVPDTHLRHPPTAMANIEAKVKELLVRLPVMTSA